MDPTSPPPSTGPTSVPGWLVRSAAVGVRLLVLAVLVWLLAVLADRLTLLLVSVLVAMLIAGVFAPVAQWLAGKGLPRWIAAGCVIGVLLVVVLGVIAGLSARVADQTPQLRDQLRSASSDLSDRLGVDLPLSGGSSGQDGQASGDGGGSSLPDGLAESSVRVVADVLVGFFLTFALAFLMLKDGPAMWSWVLSKLGGRVHDDVDAAGRAAWGTVGGYVRGLTVVALFDAAGIGIGLLLLGVPLALTLAALQFVASYVPTIGAVVAGLVAVAIAYAAEGLVTAALVLVLVVVVQQVGNDVIEPWVMGRTLPLNAAVVLIAVTAGGLLWGIAGALLFVPLAAAVSAASHELWVRRDCRPIAGG